MKNTKQVRKEMNAIQTYEDLSQFCNKYGLSLYPDVSHRGGTLGVSGSDMSRFLGTKLEFPSKFGVYCNYLGGGLRGALVQGDMPEDLKSADYETCQIFLKAMIRVYNSIEQEAGLQDENDWDWKGTKASRESGVRSAY